MGSLVKGQGSDGSSDSVPARGPTTRPRNTEPAIWADRGARSRRQTLDSELLASPSEQTGDAVGIEFVKWQMHGKFMSFPGEAYHELLNYLAAEVYHHRYPIEHGVDVLQGVVRAAAPAAIKACMANLSYWRPPPNNAS
ncbi:unnamed protein product [Discosporangium mesarthrocarpum]